MKRIVKSNEGMTNVERANMVIAPSADIKKTDGFRIDAWAILEDDEDGKKVLIIRDGSNFYGTISPTFIQGFETAVDLIPDIIGHVGYAISTQSRNGRSFLSFQLAD